MSCLGNIIWFVFGGFFAGVSWLLAGVFWCITIIGIPIGMQCFKLAALSFLPFGREIVYGGGAVSLILNIFWLILSGHTARAHPCLLRLPVRDYDYRNTVRDAAFQGSPSSR